MTGALGEKALDIVETELFEKRRTALARGTKVKNLADSCATNFERELSQLQPHLRIVDQPTATR
jgi:hypothetical protein